MRLITRAKRWTATALLAGLTSLAMTTQAWATSETVPKLEDAFTLANDINKPWEVHGATGETGALDSNMTVELFEADDEQKREATSEDIGALVREAQIWANTWWTWAHAQENAFELDRTLPPLFIAMGKSEFADEISEQLETDAFKAEYRRFRTSRYIAGGPMYWRGALINAESKHDGPIRLPEGADVADPGTDIDYTYLFHVGMQPKLKSLAPRYSYSQIVLTPQVTATGDLVNVMLYPRLHTNLKGVSIDDAPREPAIRIQRFSAETQSYGEHEFPVRFFEVKFAHSTGGPDVTQIRPHSGQAHQNFPDGKIRYRHIYVK